MAKRPEPITVAGEVRNGALVWSAGWKFVKAALRVWSDGPVEIEIRYREDTRSSRANRWLFGQVYKLMLLERDGRVTEATKLELHAQMALRHNPITVADMETGEEVKVGGPTHTMTIKRFSQFIEDVMLDGSHFYGIVWPTPRTDEDWRDGTHAEARAPIPTDSRRSGRRTQAA